MAQTPQQRAANARFAKRNEATMGKPIQAVKRRENLKSPVSKGWIVALVFLLCGGLLFELLRMLF